MTQPRLVILFPFAGVSVIAFSHLADFIPIPLHIPSNKEIGNPCATGKPQNSPVYSKCRTTSRRDETANLAYIE
jgi:hypothetical protein